VDTFRAVCGLLLTASSWAASPSDLAIAALLPPHQKVLTRAPVGVDLDFVAVVANDSAPSFAWEAGSKLGLFLQSRSKAAEVHRLAVLDGHPQGKCMAAAVFVSTGEFILSCRAATTGEVVHERFLYDLTSKTLRGSVRSPRVGIVRLQVQHEHIAFTASTGESYSFLADAPSTLFRAQLSEISLRFGERGAFTLERSSRKGVWSITERSGGKPRYYPFPPEDYLNAVESIGPWQIFGDDLYFGTAVPHAASGKGAYGRFSTASRRYEMHAPPEIAPHAATAIFVDGSHIYLGLGEKLVVVDRTTNQVRVIQAAVAIQAIVGYKGRIYLGSTAGLGILAGDQILHYFVHPDGPELQEYLASPQ
jgi:hypothetical protein